MDKKKFLQDLMLVLEVDESIKTLVYTGDKIFITLYTLEEITIG